MVKYEQREKMIKVTYIKPIENSIPLLEKKEPISFIFGESSFVKQSTTKKRRLTTSSKTMKEIDFIKDIALISAASGILIASTSDNKDITSDEDTIRIKDGDSKIKMSAQIKEFELLWRKVLRDIEYTIAAEVKRLKDDIFIAYLKEYNKESNRKDANGKKQKVSLELLGTNMLNVRFDNIKSKYRKLNMHIVNRQEDKPREIDTRLEEITDPKIRYEFYKLLETVEADEVEYKMAVNINFALKKMKLGK